MMRVVFWLIALSLVNPAQAEPAFETLAAQPWPAAPGLVPLAGSDEGLIGSGVPVLVNVWAVWCLPCREELPALNGLRSRLPQAQWRMVALNYGDETAKVEEFLARFPIDFDVWLDTDLGVSGQLPMRGLPTTFLIDAEGRLRYRLEGVADWDSPAMVEQLERLLASP